MNWDRIEGQWKQRRGKAMHHWGKVMNDELAAIAGKYEDLVGKLQERYGLAKQEAEDQDGKFKKSTGQLRRSDRMWVQFQKSLHNKKKPVRKPVGTRRPARKTMRSKSRG